MATNSRDLYAVIALAILAAAVTLLGVHVLLVRALLTIPLVLILPGYAIMALAYPDPQQSMPRPFDVNPFGAAERLILSIGGSIAVTTGGGFLLNATPWGLETKPWALLLAGTTVCAGLGALGRRHYQLRTVVAQARTRLTLRQGMQFGVALLVVVAAVGTAVLGAQRQASTGFTQFWLLPAGASTGTVQVGIMSNESSAHQYNVTLRIQDHAVKQWRAISLSPGKTWKTVVVLPARTSGPVQALLYRTERPSAVYQSTKLWSIAAPVASTSSGNGGHVG
ncbi:MAG: DUF1616 domain-containing protein [Chloroflexota bacterium]